jgi:hypothetical protein
MGPLFLYRMEGEVDVQATLVHTENISGLSTAAGMNDVHDL